MASFKGGLCDQKDSHRVGCIGNHCGDRLHVSVIPRNG